MSAGPHVIRVFIGPVQSFIASGRRTRDFWAGSFLLSLLSGTAMDQVIGDDWAGRITIPAVQDDGEVIADRTLRAIRNARRYRTGEGYHDHAEAEQDDLYGPLVGTLVNHFRAVVPADFDPAGMAEAVRQRFRILAQEVLDHFIEPALLDYEDPNREDAVASVEDRQRKAEEARLRWHVQTSGAFFEMMWVKAPPESGETSWQHESRWLDRRKTVRIHPPVDEMAGDLPGTGDRCSVHPDMCELGGHSRVYEREQQDDFWQVLRRTVGTKMYDGVWSGAGAQFRDTLEIREGERLSGMALVKRLFPLLPAERIARAIGWIPSHDYDFGIETPPPDWTPREAQRALRNWPSTAFIAAVPWIVTAASNAEQAANEYTKKQYSLLGSDPIWEAERPQHHRIQGIDRLKKVLENRGGVAREELPRFAMLDGTLHFMRGLEKHRFVKWSRMTGEGDGRENAEKLARDLATNFKALVRNAEEPIRDTLKIESLKENPAAPFYAMLEMDGDDMGTIFSRDEGLAVQGSRALLEFSNGIAKIVREHDGVLVYAGADDVSAMLPVDTALPCAVEIREHWQRSMQIYFPVAGDDRLPTLSGSIVFADYQNALDDVRLLTHERLDRVAKDGLGRDALALAVMKSGGVTAEWASAWTTSDIPGTSTGETHHDPVRTLFEFARFAMDAKTVASRLPHVIRKRFDPVLATTIDGVELFDDDQLAQLLVKELSDSGIESKGTGDEDRERRIQASANLVTQILRPYGRKTGDTVPRPAPRHVGGLLVARFLAENVFWPYFAEWEVGREERAGGGE